MGNILKIYFAKNTSCIMRKDGDYMKIYVQAIMDEDVYDELCSYPEHRVSIIEGSRMETESIIANDEKRFD